MLTTIRDFIGQNWLSTTISILAVIYAFYEARRRRGPRLAYQFTGLRVIGTKRDRLPNEVEIRFRGDRIKNLSQTQIIVWNKGDAPLRDNDVPPHDPLTFCFAKPCTVFLAEITKCTRDVNKAVVEITPNDASCVKLSFDFLDKGDGALISIWHSAEDVMPDCRGTVLGQKEGLLSYGRFMMQRRDISEHGRPSKTVERVAMFISKQAVVRSFTSIMPLLMMVIGLALAIAPFAHDLGIPFTSPSESGDGARIGATSAGLLYFITGLMFYHSMRRRFPKDLLPDEFLASPVAPKAEAEGHR